MKKHRRDFLKTASCFALLGTAAMPRFGLGQNAVSSAIPIIDAHIHLFDPTRPGGVPWPDASDTAIYKPALPPRLESLAAPFGIVGAIAVECSPLLEDNDWLLKTASQYPLIVGVIGNLDPASPDFAHQLELRQANPLFRGIRYGNLWGRNLSAQVNNPVFIGNLKRLSDAGLLLESANPDPSLIAAILKLKQRIPELKIIIDHLPHAVPLSAPAARKDYERDLQSLSQYKDLFVKGSEVLRRIDGKVPKELNFYKPWLDEIWEIFGEDRLLYGSDWPNSDHLASYADTYGMIQQYVSGKGRRSVEKFFWKNSITAYRWKARNAAQATGRRVLKPV